MSDTFAAAALRLDSVARIYKEGEGQLEVFRNVNLVLYPGELVALVGPRARENPRCCTWRGLLEEPTAGEIVIGGSPASSLSDGERTRSAATPSASSIRPTICCRNSPRWRMSSSRR